MTDVFTAANVHIFDALAVAGAAEDGTYTRDGVITPVRVVLERDLSRWGDEINVSTSSAMISVLTMEVPNRPVRGDTFEIPSGTYYVEQTMVSDGYMHQCLAVEA